MAELTWVGIKAQTQKELDDQLPGLLKYRDTALMFVDLRGLREPISFTSQGTIPATGDHPNLIGYMVGRDDDESSLYPTRGEAFQFSGIAWVITGGGNDPVHPDWIRSLRDQCQEAGVAFFFEGWGDWLPEDQNIPDDPRPDKCMKHFVLPGGMVTSSVGKKTAGRLLDGREWNEVPE